MTAPLPSSLMQQLKLKDSQLAHIKKDKERAASILHAIKQQLDATTVSRVEPTAKKAKDVY